MGAPSNMAAFNSMRICNKPVLQPGLRVRRALPLLMAVLATTTLISCGITAPRSDAGYADLDSPGMLDTQRTTALSIGPTLLRFAARYLDDDPEIKALLQSLDGIRIRTYDVHGDSERVSRNLQNLGQKLQADHWAPVMLVHQDGEHIQMFAKSSLRGIQGLTLVSSDDREVTIINIMGTIDPVHFNDVMLALDIDHVPEARLATVN